jgi:hypothetical protein
LRFEVLVARMLIVVLWAVTPYGLVGYQHFRRIYGLYLYPAGNRLHTEYGGNTFLLNIGTDL